MKRVLITGASSGIGRACAELLAKKGYSLILLARREERLAALKLELEKKFKVEILSAVVDVCDHKQIEAFVKTHGEALGELYALINNAGLARGTDKVQTAQICDWESMIDTNVKGLLFMTRAILPQMLKAQCGHIVNLGSVAGRWVYPGGAVYCATKFAVRALSEGLRMDVLGSGIRVTNIEPGMVETEFSQVRLQSEERAKAVYKGMTPLQAEDVAEAIVWCLDRPDHVNIQELVIYPTDQASPQLVDRR